MFINYFILALSSSIDSLGIGITYGIRKTSISFSAKIILFFLSLLITTLSVYIGKFLISFLPKELTVIIGSLILMFMGCFIIYQVINPKKEQEKDESKNTPKVYRFFIDFLGITIHIIRNPIYSDLDNSNQIDFKEALYLGIALSLDSICIGIGSSMINSTLIIFPLLVSIFQIVFLTFGKYLGEKIANISKIPDYIWNIISGLLLIFIGICKLSSSII